MDDLLAEFQRLVADLPGTGLIGALTLLERQLDPAVAQQLRLCAIPHQFDERLLMVMTPALDEVQARALCADIGQLSVVLARGESYALHDEARDHLLAWWLREEQAESFAGVSARLADHFDRRARDTSEGPREHAERQRMFHRLGADQAAGFEEFERLFRLMRHQFRLDACETLAHLAHEYDAVLTADHLARLVYHEGKLAADRRAWSRAGQLFGRVLASDAVNPVTRIKARNRLGCVVAETHEWAHAIELQKTALDDVRSLQHPGTLEYRVMHDLGAAYRDSGDLDEARKALTESVALAESAGDVSAQATAYNSLGTLWRRLGDTPEAIRAYEKSLGALLHTDDPYRPAQVYNNLGVACSELRNWDQSEIWFTRSLEIKRKAGDTVGQATTLSNLARVYQQRGEIDRAIETLEHAIVLFGEMHDQSSIAVARRQIGRLHAIAGRSDAARAALSGAADIWESSGNADEAAATRKERNEVGRRRVPGWLMMFGTAIVVGAGVYWWLTTQPPGVKGQQLIEQGRPAEAIEPLTQALAADPGNPTILANRGFAHYQLGNYENAIADLSKAIDVQPNDAIDYVIRGDAFGVLGRFEAALSDFQKAISLDPASAAAFRNRGVIYERQGKPDEALAEYSKAISLGDPLAYTLRARSHQVAGRHEQAIADFTKFIELSPDDTTAYSQRFISNYQLRRDRQALEDADKGIALAPEDGAHWNNRGVVRIQLERHQDALDDLSKSIALQPDVPNGYNHRGRVEAHLNQLDAALADFSKAIEVDPSYAMAYGNRGFVYHLQGDRDRARADYLKQIELERARTPTSRPLVLLALDATQSTRPKEAAAYCDQALSIIGAGERNAYYRDEPLAAAFCKLMIGKTEDALADYRSAAATAGSSARNEAILRLRLLPASTRGAAAAVSALSAQ